MMGWKRGFLTVACVGALSLIAFAQNASIRLTSYPAMSVADGRSSLTITAEVRERGGKLVPDGTKIVFSTTIGSFREPVVETSGGMARGILVAGSIAGTARITASALTFSAVSTLDIEFVSDRSLLNSAKEYIEVTANPYLMYSTDLRILGAAGSDRGVSLRYREVEVDADDVQLNVPTYELRARKALLRIGKHKYFFDDLYLKLNERRGYGTTTATLQVPRLVQVGTKFVPVVEERERYGVVQISASSLRLPSEFVPPSLFEFEDLSEAATAISAKKAVVFPRKEVHFHSAEIYVGPTRVLKLPLFQVSIYGQTPILTEQIFNVYDNQVSVNYPHYLSLRPGTTSLLRFRAGDQYGRNYSTSGGMFMDYELNWNQGDDMDGGMIFSGIGRSDWGAGIRQYWKFNDRASMSAQVDFPAHKSLFGSGMVQHVFDGFQATLSANSSRSIRGPKYQSENYAFVVEKDPTRLGSYGKLYLGLTATQSRTQSTYFNREQEAYGARARFQMIPKAVDRDTTLNASAMVSRLYGSNTNEGLTFLADFSLSRRLGRSASMLVSYNFAEDAYTSSLTGRHSLSLQTYYSAGNTSISLFGSKSLDLDRHNYFVDASYRLSSLWRLSSSHTISRYVGQSYVDGYYMISYRLGYREVGLLYSTDTKRLGIQILGAYID